MLLAAAHMSTLTIVLIVCLLVVVFGGGYGYHQRNWAIGASPLGVVLLVLLVLWLAGRI
jgi:hypothetical protein